MNFAVQGSMEKDSAQGNRRFLMGIGVSIAVHVLLMFAYRHSGTVLPAAAPEPQPLVVFIRPPPPVPPRVEQAPPRPAGPVAQRSARKPLPKRVIAVPASAREAPANPFVVQQPDAPVPAPAPAAEGAPTFDMNAAKQTARSLAGQTKLGREGTAVAQFPEPPLETESKYAKAISKAKRRNCKDGLPGGLLAPLFLMMDKKDSGCKW